MYVESRSSFLMCDSEGSMYMYVCVQMHTCLGVGGRCLQRPELVLAVFPTVTLLVF